jgi:hypothetical protein
MEKSKIEYLVQIVDSKEMGGGDDEELQATITKAKIEKKT